MRMPWSRSKRLLHNGTASEVDRLKDRTHDSVARTDENIQRLNRLLRSNGITLKIYKATHGNH
jgi:hypothetical protein